MYSLLSFGFLIACFVVQCCSAFKRKHKYPFYRPWYNATQLVFEPFFNALSEQPSLLSQKNHRNHNGYAFQKLYDFIVAQSTEFSSYHNLEQHMQEMDYISAMAKTYPWSEFLTFSEESKSVDANPLHRIIVTSKSSTKLAADTDTDTDTDVPPPQQLLKPQKIKLLLIFGEHPREFIVSESMFDLLLNFSLSYIHPNAEIRIDYMRTILDAFEIHILPVLNPDGKKYLEESENYCWRWNTQSHSVDLNRNFDWEFAGKGSTHHKGTEEWHGAQVFSEPEAKYLNDLLLAEQYTCVIDIHSGTQQIFVPFVDSESRKTHRTRDETEEELRLVTYIQSQSQGWYKNSGIAWKFNDYGADGTIMDYVGGKIHSAYSLCAEIYGDPDVDMSIDCFVQFNPNNGRQFVDALRQIRTLYTGTFDYFLGAQMQSERIKLNLLQTAKSIKQLLLN